MHNYCKETASVYQRKKDKNGAYVLEQVGETNVYEAIQSHRDEVDMYQILQRAKVTGDYSQIKGNAGVYADIADYPRSFNEAQKLVSKMPQKFAELPDEIRGAFDSYTDFISSVANGSVQSKIIDYNNKLEQQAIAEQKEVKAE